MSRSNGSPRGEKSPREDKPNAAAQVVRMQGAAIERTASAMVKATGDLQDPWSATPTCCSRRPCTSCAWPPIRPN